MLERILMAAHRGLAGCSAVAGAEAGSALGKDTSREGGSRQGSEAAGRGDVASRRSVGSGGQGHVLWGVQRCRKAESSTWQPMWAAAVSTLRCGCTLRVVRHGFRGQQNLRGPAQLGSHALAALVAALRAAGALLLTALPLAPFFLSGDGSSVRLTASGR